MSQRTGVSTIRFDATLYMIDQRTILRLPEKASGKLPSRGQVAVQGTLNGNGFQTVLEPDGSFGHWMVIDETLRQTAALRAGDTATLFGKSDDAWLRMFPGGHDYSKPMRETVVGFFDKYLRGVGDGSPVQEPALATEPPDSPELYVLPEPPAKTLTMRGIAEGMFATVRSDGTWGDFVTLNGGLPAPVPVETRKLGEAQGRVYHTFVSERGLTIPAIVWPAPGPTRAVVVLVSENGKAGAAREFRVDDLLKAGITCVAIDPRGLGELKDMDLRLTTYLGRSPAFMMSWDIARAIDAFATGPVRVAVVGLGPTAGQAALMAALLDGRVGFVAGLGTLKAFEDAFRNDVPLLSIQPRANYAPALGRLRGLVKGEAIWGFLGENEPDWAAAIVRWAGR
jgi:hypothetical protein